MISKKLSLIYIHIPKSGGTSMMNFLRSIDEDLIGEGHIGINFIKSKYGISCKDFSEYLKFSIVRNPFHLAVSIYEYSRMKKSYWHSDDGSTKYGVHKDYNILCDKSFDEFADLLIRRKLKGVHSQNIQSSYCKPSDLDLIIRLENLNKGLYDLKKSVYKNTGININIENFPHSNSTKKNFSYPEYYKNEKTIEKIVDFYEKDFDLFGYKKEVF